LQNQSTSLFNFHRLCYYWTKFAGLYQHDWSLKMEKALKWFVRWGWIPALIIVGILYLRDLMAM